jgi:hypothetical protein
VQVWTIGAAGLLWIEKRFPNIIFDSLFVSAIVKANGNYQRRFNASPEGRIKLDSKAPESADVQTPSRAVGRSEGKARREASDRLGR